MIIVRPSPVVVVLTRWLSGCSALGRFFCSCFMDSALLSPGAGVCEVVWLENANRLVSLIVIEGSCADLRVGAVWADDAVRA